MQNPFKKWGTSPEADWQIMFSIFLSLLLAAIVGCTAFFYMAGGSSSSQDDIATEVLNQNALHRAALYYDQKSAAFNQIKSTSETTPDPSR